MSQDSILKLLIVEESLNDAEMLISVLRNAGHAVRPTRGEDDEDVQKALEEGTFDLFLCSTLLEELTINQACEMVEQSGKDVPIIAVSNHDDLELRASVIKLGACDLVSKNDLEHLQLIVKRELKNKRVRQEYRKLHRALHETEKRCHALLDSSRDAITYVHEGMHLYANESYLEKFGFTEFEEIEGMPILDLISSDYQSEFKEFLRELSKGKNDVSELDVKMISDGKSFNARMDFSAASIEGEPCTQIIIREQNQHNPELEAQLDTMSKQDLLTGLYNRQYFIEQLEKSINQNFGKEGAKNHGLMFILLDSFKTVKESLGISSADVFIGEVADLLKVQIEDEDTIIARFGDASFTVLVKNRGIVETQAFGEKIRAAMEGNIAEIDGQCVTCTTSIGLVMIGDSTANASMAISAADNACTIARQDGGNRLHIFKPVQDSPTSETSEHNWNERIKHAFDHESFYLVYQPIASLQGETEERYEVRIRLSDGEDGEIAPMEFIPAAEKTNQMAEIDKWVIAKSFEILAERRDTGVETHFFIKLSANFLQLPDAVQFVAQQFERTRLEPSAIVFQLAEPVIVTHLKQARDFFVSTHQLRCKFTIDHFGAGLNSFQLVKHIPADYLKIDTTVIDDLATNNATQDHVRKIVELAHEGNRKVIASHLEDATSLAVLWQYNIDYVQGFFLQEPEAELNHDFSGFVI